MDNGELLLYRDEDALPSDARAACEGLWERTWPTPPDFVPDPARVNGKFLRVLLVDDGAQQDGAPGVVLAGACGLLERTITVNGRSRRIAGLQGVVVEEAYRRRGHGRRMVRTALDEARGRGYAFGVLFCGAHRRTFYEGLGWRLLEGTITKTRFGEERPVDELVMALPLTPEAAGELPSWITARIHVGVGQW